MRVRLPLALLSAATLAACQPPEPTTTVTLAPDAAAATVATETPATVTVVPDAAAGATVGVTAGVGGGSM
jgi:hypothetical protein